LLLSDPSRATGRADPMAAGATAFLDKPFDFMQLEAVVASLIRKAEAASLKAAVAELEVIRDSIYDCFAELG
jgi:DNA-binding response OmpR family regulator